MKSILITGAGSGVGRGLALCFAELGHPIVATDLTAADAEATAAQIRDAGGQAEGRALDVRSEEQVNALWDSLEDHPMDVLVNTAGVQHVAALEEFPVEKWDLLMDVMMRGTFLMTRAALAGMKARNFGRIIHVGSVHAQVALPHESACVAGNHALQGFSKVTALETARHEITSNIICPGPMRTPLADAQIRDQARARGLSEREVVDQVILEPMPKKTFITFQEVAAAAEFLISPLARNITGQAITIDGGWTAR